MRMPRRSVLVAVAVSLALLPATSAAAKPVSTYTVNTGANVQTGDTRVAVIVTFSDAGTDDVQLLRTRVSLVDCDGVLDVKFERWSFEGLADLEFSVDRRLETVHVAGTVDAIKTTEACGSTDEVTEPVDFELAGTAASRPSRWRDSETGTRYISRVVELSVSVDGVVGTTSGVIVEAIAKG